jgi:hypothetical protein
MTPDTVHAIAQWIRHSRGLLTTLEKWLARTPPEAQAQELAEMIAVARGAFAQIEMRLGSPRPSAAPSSAPAHATGDRPAEMAARSSSRDVRVAAEIDHVACRHSHVLQTGQRGRGPGAHGYQRDAGRGHPVK